MSRVTTIVRTILLLFVATLLIVFLYPFDSSARKLARSSACRTNLSEIGMALMQYQQDYDEKFPPVSSGREGWADVVQPYLKSRSRFICPSSGVKSEQPTSDYFYNARLSGLRVSEIRGYKPTITKGNVTSGGGWSKTIIAGDGIAGAGTNSHITELPFEWRSDENSPARRHFFNNANYLFTDGHVERHKPERVGTMAPRKDVNEATFAIR